MNLTNEGISENKDDVDMLARKDEVYEKWRKKLVIFTCQTYTG